MNCKRSITGISICLSTFGLLSLVSRPVTAQSSPEVGVWKLNLAKSKFYNLLTPKSETRIVKAEGDGVNVHMVGVAGDGSRIDFSYSYTYSAAASTDGDVVVRRLDAHTFLGTSKKGGKVVATTRVVLSDDEKTMPFFESGMDDQGKPTGYTAVYDKQ
jgi:hypothetical protein